MLRRESDYHVVYVSRQREVVHEIPRRSATSRDYDARSYASEKYNERLKGHSDRCPRDDTIFVTNLSNNYGPDAYYQPSKTPRDSYQPKRPIAEERRSARFATEDYQRRRRSSDDHTRRRPDPADGYYNARGDRGRMDERRSSPSRRLRSAMRGSRNESPEAQRRARARSVSFRETEASRHDVGNQKHERPGYEARAMGQYLRCNDDDDLASETHAVRRKLKRYL